MATDEKQSLIDEIKKVEQLRHTISDKVLHARDSAFARFPFVFIFLTTFGLVATFYGFEKVIEGIPYFVDNPHMILVTGVITLIATGTPYKKLS